MCTSQGQAGTLLRVSGCLGGTASEAVGPFSLTPGVKGRLPGPQPTSSNPFLNSTDFPSEFLSHRTPPFEM